MTSPLPSSSPTDALSELRHRLALEELVLSISTNLVASDDVDGRVRDALRSLVEFIGADRAFVFQLSQGPHANITHEYGRPGARSAIRDFREVPRLSLAWGRSRLSDGLVIEAPSWDALPAEGEGIREAMRTLEIHSAMIVPLVTGGKAIGGMGFDWLGRAGSWSPATIALLRVAGQLIATALSHARSDRELREAERRLRSFVRSTPDAVFCLEPPVDATGSDVRALCDGLAGAVVVECNDAYAKLFGHADAGGVQGKRLAEVGASAVALVRPLCQQLSEGASHVDAVELKHLLPEGGARYLLAQARQVVEGGRLQRLWGVCRDVTDRKASELARDKLEAQLRQAQKMESIGLLAGGIAHDFNNLLVVISNYAQFALDEVTRDAAAVEMGLKQILKACDRATELTRGLLTFGRRQVIARKPVDLNNVVRDTLAMLRRIVRESIEIDFLPGHELGVVNGDAGQLEQMLVNLCVNASDAMPGSGRITVETENVKLNGAYIKAHPWARPGRYVLLTVTDTGEGMPAEVRERIFEPFFTTKPHGKGTGLGLAIVYGIVKQHDGMIHVYSEVGTGTTFKLYLPIVERTASSVGVKVETAPRGGSETILVAEDHDMVRELVRGMLERAGYRVLLARDGGEAIQMFDQHTGDLQLVLLDAVMPVVPGHDVYAHIAKVRPELPVLVSSGYASGVFPSHFFADKGIDVVPKPYDSDDLLRRIREAIDKRRA